MPTVLRVGPYRFFFFSNEGDEPAHIHVRRDSALAKYWLRPIMLASSSHFSAAEIRKVRRLVAANEQVLLEAWDEHFGD